MEYFLSFIEGMATFISPCLLPMLPIYISYFAGGDLCEQGKQKYKPLVNAIGFVMGFTIVFLLLGAAAGTFGKFVKQHATGFNLLGGALLVLFGLNFMNAINIGFLNRTQKINLQINTFNFFTSILFGFIFAFGWTPCVGAFLGSALLLAVNSHQAFKGVIMLLLFSLGLGIPFVLAAVLLDSLKQTLDAIKRHYRTINILSGLLLVVVGILMMLGKLNVFLSLVALR